MIPLAPDFGGVSSIIRLRSGPKESPERQCLATAELKTKILWGNKGRKGEGSHSGEEATKAKSEKATKPQLS